MTCKYKVSVLEKCYGCGRKKKVYKCKKINLIIGRTTCRVCKYYIKKDSKESNQDENL